MKKILLFALMGLVMMGSFTSCKKDKQEKEFKEKIVGKWKSYSHDGILHATNEKAVDEFFTDGTATCTYYGGTAWACAQARTYKITGNKFSKYDGDKETLTATIASITDSYVNFNNGSFPLVANSNFDEYVIEKVTVDYKQSIIGLWEGTSITGEQTYGDEKHRWKFNADGTYIYYTKNAADQWDVDPSNTGNQYYVDGNFYGSRWNKDGSEYREAWDINYCNDTEMRWSALRKKEDGSFFTTTMTMKRIVEN